MADGDHQPVLLTLRGVVLGLLLVALLRYVWHRWWRAHHLGPLEMRGRPYW